MYCMLYGDRLKNICISSWQSRVAVVLFLFELFENRIFVGGPGHFHLKFSVCKPNCSNSETFENRGLTVQSFLNAGSECIYYVTHLVTLLLYLAFSLFFDQQIKQPTSTLHPN